jgi:ATP-binding cassette, subfamily C (CFTR/MRP), member 1
MGPARVAWNQGVQKRVAQTSSMLAQMKGIKMMGLSDYIMTSIQGYRVVEVNISKKFRMMVVWLNAIGESSRQLMSGAVLY